MSERVTRDEEQLDLLAIFHFVVAGVGAIFALIPSVHLLIGLAFIFGAFPTEPEEGAAGFIGWMFVLIAAPMILAGLALAVCVALAGRALQRRERYMFCLVIAGILCFVFPFGTVLGVFTIVVLQRDTVKPLFGRPVATVENRS